MRRQLHKFLSLFLALCLLISLVPMVFAEGDEDDGDSSSSEIVEIDEQGEVYFADDAEVEGSDTSDDDGVIDGEADDSSLNSIEDLGGADIFIDSDIIALEELNAEEGEEENLGPGVDSDDNTFFGDGDIGASGPQISLSAGAVHVSKGATETIKVTLTGFYGDGRINVSPTNSSFASFSFGSWSGNTIPLYVKGVNKGNCNVYITLYNSSNTALFRVRFSLYVEETPSMSVNPSNVTIQQGSAKNVRVVVGGYHGSVKIRAWMNSGGAFSAKWIAADSSSATMTISGNRAGSGTITVEMFDAISGTTIKSATISVSISGTPKITLSASSVAVKAGSRYTVKVTCSNYSGVFYASWATTNEKVATLQWGDTWTDSTIPLYITGTVAGSATVYVYMKDARTDQTLAYKTITVSVSQDPVIKASTSSVSIKAGDSKEIYMTVSGLGGTRYISWGGSNDAAFSCENISFQDGVARFKITGKNAGSGTITFNLLNASKQTVATSKVSVTVTPNGSPKVVPDFYSTTVPLTGSVVVPVTVSNVASEWYLQCDWSSAPCCSCSWGSRSGSTYQLIINGEYTGSGTVKVYLKRSSDNVILASTSIAVKVNSASLASQLSYRFKNFREAAHISLCKYMFGDNATATAIYNMKLGNGGNCFGMATTSGMFYCPGNGVNVSDFNSNANVVYDLNINDKGSFVLNVKEFIECMQIAQVSCPKTVVVESNLKSLIDNVAYQCGSLSKPVRISIRGTDDSGKSGGHSVLAFGVEQVNSTTYRLLISDSNYPLETRYLYINKDSGGNYASWSYNLSPSLRWGTGDKNAVIGYSNYSAYYSVWQNRGHLSLDGYDLLASNVSDFTILDVYGQEVATISDGNLLTDNTEITQIYYSGYNIDATEEETWYMYYIPSDLYTIKNNADSEEMTIVLSNENLAVNITTTANEVTLCADDASNICSAMLKTDGTATYDISIISSREGDPETIKYQGECTDTRISVMLDNGNLSTCNTESASITIGDANTGEAEELIFSITASASEGGSITPDGKTDVIKGGTETFSFDAFDGFVVSDVLVDGESVGAINSYTFENVQGNHTIHAVFERIEYEISATATEGGTITPAGIAAVAEGASATYSIAPNSGYVIKDVLVDEQSVGAVETYTFENVTSNHTIHAVFEAQNHADNCPGSIFTDMPLIGNWAHDAIDWAIVNKITAGTSATTFSPNAGCTRAQVVTFLWRAAGEPEPTTNNNPFSDVKEGTYYYKAVLWAVEKKVTAGTSATTFSPDTTCTRAQIVTFLWRYDGEPAATATANPFTDVKAGAYYEKAVLWASETGVTAGTSATTFSPENTCTRAQVVTFLYRDMVK